MTMIPKTAILIIRIVLILSFSILLVRLFELQIIRGNYYKELANGNRLRRVIIKAPRGEIFARGGEYLVKNDKENEFVLYKPDKGHYVSDSVSDGAERVSDVDTWERDYPLKASSAHITGYVGLVNESEVNKLSPNAFT